MNSMRATARSFGEIANLVLTAFFIASTLFFLSQMKASIVAGGGVARISDLGMGWIAQQAADPHIVHKVVAWVFAWGFGSAMLGCAWMSVLGLRWSYHALLRAIRA